MIHQRLKCKCGIAMLLLATLAGRAAEEGGNGGGSVDFQMVIWTWVVFILLALILYKFAFKPVLGALDDREASIRDGVEKADQARAEMARIEATRDSMILAAEEKAKELIEEGRKAAREAARVIQDKAKDESQIMLENARREIKSAADSARAELRRESGRIAIQLASKVIEENLDDARNQALVDKLIKEI